MGFIRRRDLKEAKRRISELKSSIKEVDVQNKKIMDLIDNNKAQIMSFQEKISDLNIEIFAYKDEIEDNKEWLSEANAELEKLQRLFEDNEVRACDKTRPECERSLSSFHLVKNT